MKTSRRGIIIAAAFLAAITSVVGCGGADAPTSPRRVTVVLDWTPNTNHSGVYLAKQAGIYDAAGLEVEIIEPGEAGGLPQLAAGNAHFAFSYAEQLLPARAQGAGVVSIATVLTTNTSSLVAPADRRIQRPRDLAGKIYGTYGGSIERPLIEALVRCDGGDPGQVQFVDVGNVDYRVGFTKGMIDVVWAFDGWDVIRLREIQKTPISTIPFREHLDCIPDWYTPIITTSDDLIGRDPELVRDFLAATAAGYTRAAADPLAAADALVDAIPESDRELVTASARFLTPFYIQPGKSWGHQDAAVWKRFDRFLRTNGIVTRPDAVTAAFTNAFLPTGG